MPLFIPEINQVLDRNNPKHIVYAIDTKPGFEIRAYDQRTMPIPTPEPVKVIPQKLKKLLTNTDMHGIAITILRSKDQKSLYRKIKGLPNTTLTTNTTQKTTDRLDQLLWAVALAAPIGLAILCLRSARISSDQTPSLNSTFNQSIFSKAVFDTLEKTMALLPEAVQPH